MARKERNNIDYFPHSVSHGKKMFYLRDKFKNDGYAVWFMLLEELGKADYHYLDLKDPIQLMYLSSEFKVSELMLNEIIETLVKFDEFDKELWSKEKILFNQKFNENISDAYKKRNNDCINKDSLLSLLIAKGRSLSLKSTPKPPKPISKGVINTQSIVEYSKENKNNKENDDNELIETTKKIKQIEIVYAQFVKEVKSGYHQQWAEATYMRLKIKKGSLTKLLTDFKNQLIVDLKAHKTTAELKDHLNHWLNKQDQIGKLKQYRKKPIGAL
ncbi:MAG: DUF4373 domain-containing protein [Flavobacteriaceae bacterium]